jgi:hypothetical protein
MGSRLSVVGGALKACIRPLGTYKVTRLPRVIFGALYVLVLVLTVLIALQKIGFGTGPIGPIVIVLLLAAADQTHPGRANI